MHLERSAAKKSAEIDNGQSIIPVDPMMISLANSLSDPNYNENLWFALVCAYRAYACYIGHTDHTQGAKQSL